MIEHASGGIVALAAVLASGLTLAWWPLAGHAVTMAHEGGHAIATLALGGRVRSVRLHRDGSGVTNSELPAARHTVVLLTGYLGPSGFGLVGAVLLAHGWPSAVLWISLGLLVLLLLVSRSWFAWLAIPLSAVGFVLAIRFGAQTVQVLVGCTWVWLLLFGGLVDVLRTGSRGGDHAMLRRRTGIPAPIWAAIFVVVAGASLIWGAAMLAGFVAPPI